MNPRSKVQCRAYFAPDSNLLIPICQTMQRAKKTLILASYALTARDVTRLLITKAKAGVEVKVILDAVGERNNTLASQLTQRGVETRLVQCLGAQGHMHHKYIVVDRSFVITGSFNFSHATYSSDENLIIMKSRVLADAYRSNFASMWMRPFDQQTRDHKTTETLSRINLRVRKSK